MKPSTTTTTLPVPLQKLSFSTTLTNGSVYEPTSVLDPTLNSSPSSSAPAISSDHHQLLLDTTTITTTTNNSNSSGNNNSILPISSDPFDDWDPLTFLLLDSSSDSTTPNTPTHTNTSLSLHEFSYQFSPTTTATTTTTTNFDLDSLFPSPPTHVLIPSPSYVIFEQNHLNQLIRAAQAVESNEQNLACTILSRLEPHLKSPTGSPLQRASFYFKEALHSLLLPFVGDNQDDHFSLSLSTLDIVRKISAFKSFSDLSPIPQFSSFTANQSILDAFFGDFSRPIHIIDFDIGLGGQWSSFLHEIATRCMAQRVVVATLPSVMITAVVAEETLETSLMAENLRDFAVGLGIKFNVECVRVGGMGPVALGAVRLAAGENVAVSFTPAVVRLLTGGASSNTVVGFLRFVKMMAPKVVVFVDTESSCIDSGPDRSFRRSFMTRLEYYSVLLESLDSATLAIGVSDDQVSRIERALLRPRIMASVRSWGIQCLPWKEILNGAGFKPLHFSEFTQSQAEWLSRRAPGGGFHVARRDGSITLSRQGKELSATSAWKC